MFTVPEDGLSVELCAVIIEGILGRSVDVSLATQPVTATGET